MANAVIPVAAAEWLLGMGGKVLDPKYGATYFLRELAKLSPGLLVPPPYDYTNAPQVAAEIKKLPLSVLLFLFGDSCGANRLSYLLKLIHPRKVEYAAFVQASSLCNAGCPPIPDNVELVDVFYNDWWRSIPPFLGNYKPQLEHPPAGKITYPGVYTGNNGKTKIRYIYAPGSHPGDDLASTRTQMLSRVHTTLIERVHTILLSKGIRTNA